MDKDGEGANGEKRTLTFSASAEYPLTFDFGPKPGEWVILLGGVEIKPSSLDPHWGHAHIEVEVAKVEEFGFTYYDIAHDNPKPNVDVLIDDVMDYNYWNDSWTAELSDAPRSAAMIQCSFKQKGITNDSIGQIALVSIEVNGEVDNLSSFTRKSPIEDPPEH